VEIDPELVPEGSELYQDNCAACHGTAGAGAALTSGVVAPDLYASSALETVEAIRIGPGTMPVFGPETLDDEQVDAIAGYVRYLDDPADRGGAPLGRVGPVTEGMVGWLIGLGSLVIAIRLIGTKVKR
jgi:ubiquinol-cytochrome c reductase cytochrome c subunit